MATASTICMAAAHCAADPATAAPPSTFSRSASPGARSTRPSSKRSASSSAASGEYQTARGLCCCDRLLDNPLQHQLDAHRVPSAAARRPYSALVESVGDGAVTRDARAGRNSLDLGHDVRCMARSLGVPTANFEFEAV